MVGIEVRDSYEACYTSCIQRSARALRVRQYFFDPLDPQGRYFGGNLLELPSVLHRQAEADGHRRPRRALPPQVRQERSSCGSGSSGEELALSLRIRTDTSKKFSPRHGGGFALRALWLRLRGVGPVGPGPQPK